QVNRWVALAGCGHTEADGRGKVNIGQFRKGQTAVGGVPQAAGAALRAAATDHLATSYPYIAFAADHGARGPSVGEAGGRRGGEGGGAVGAVPELAAAKTVEFA